MRASVRESTTGPGGASVSELAEIADWLGWRFMASPDKRWYSGPEGRDWRGGKLDARQALSEKLRYYLPWHASRRERTGAATADNCRLFIPGALSMNAPLHREIPASILDAAQALSQVTAQWDGDIVKQITDYIAIPAKSPTFDSDWAQHGFIDTVMRNAASWVEAQKVEGLTLEIVRLEGRTPVLFFEIPATRADSTQTVLMYGHLDKQPEFSGWRNDLGPWTPKYIDGKLYGRGGADDGYAVYASIAAVQALKAQNVAHPRIVGLIESCEESGSYDLPPYIDALKTRLGDVALVVCLDSGAGNYDQLWLTTSLRGNAAGVLKVEILTEGVHSGDASGLVPSSFRIMRQVLDRLEDSKTGRLLPQSFHCEIPADRLVQAQATAKILGDEIYKRDRKSVG